MKLAVLTCGTLPIPAVQGGAVENLIDFYLEYNNRENLHVHGSVHPRADQAPGMPGQRSTLTSTLTSITMSSSMSPVSKQGYQGRYTAICTITNTTTIS